MMFGGVIGCAQWRRGSLFSVMMMVMGTAYVIVSRGYVPGMIVIFWIGLECID